MEILVHPLLKEKKIISKALSSQERWRQKQLDIFYRTGRPIFTVDKASLHFFTKF